MFGYALTFASVMLRILDRWSDVQARWRTDDTWSPFASKSGFLLFFFCAVQKKRSKKKGQPSEALPRISNHKLQNSKVKRSFLWKTALRASDGLNDSGFRAFMIENVPIVEYVTVNRNATYTILYLISYRIRPFDNPHILVRSQKGRPRFSSWNVQSQTNVFSTSFIAAIHDARCQPKEPLARSAIGRHSDHLHGYGGADHIAGWPGGTGASPLSRSLGLDTADKNKSWHGAPRIVAHVQQTHILALAGSVR